MATVAATGGSPTGQEPTEQPLLKTAKEPQPDEPDEPQPAQPVWPDAYLDTTKELVTVEVNRSREEDIPGPSTDLTETGQRKDTGAEIAKRPNLDEVPYSSVLAWAITDGSEKPTQSWLYAQCQQAGLQMPRDFMEVEVYSNGRPTAALKFWKRTHNETDAMEYFLTREDDKFFLSAYKEAGLITAMKALQPVLSRGVMGVPPNATIAIRTLTAADLIEPREPKANEGKAARRGNVEGSGGASAEETEAGTGTGGSTTTAAERTPASSHAASPNNYGNARAAATSNSYAPSGSYHKRVSL